MKLLGGAFTKVSHRLLFVDNNVASPDTNVSPEVITSMLNCKSVEYRYVICIDSTEEHNKLITSVFIR